MGLQQVIGTYVYNNNRLLITGCILLIVSPLMALPYIIYLINKEVKGATYLVAFFMAVFAFLFPPMGDLYKQNMIYFNWDSPDLFFWLQSQSKADFLIWGMSMLFSFTGIKFEYIRFFITLYEFCLFAYIYENYLLNRTIPHRIKVRTFLLMCVGFIPLYQILGMRHGLAICLFLNAVVQLYLEKKWKYSLVFFVLAIFTHFHFLPLSIVAIANYYYSFVKSNKIFVLYVVVGFVFGSFLTLNFVNVFYEGSAKAEGYTDMDNEYGGGMSFSGSAGMGMLIDRLWYIPLIVGFMLKKIKTNDKIESLIYILGIMVAITWSFHTFSERSGKVLGTLLCTFCALYPHASKKMMHWYPILMFLLLFMQLYGLRLLMFYTDNNLADIWKPLPICLQDEYTIKWLNNNVSPEGDLISVGAHWSL